MFSLYLIVAFKFCFRNHLLSTHVLQNWPACLKYSAKMVTLRPPSQSVSYSLVRGPAWDTRSQPRCTAKDRHGNGIGKSKQSAMPHAVTGPSA
ncbi:hypothetical protein CapIbe_011005 [Capra ibex]